jgi:hypothetical protein
MNIMREIIATWCLLVVSTIACHSQDDRPSVDVFATPSASTTIPHAACVDRLLADGGKGVPYADVMHLHTNDVRVLIERYRSISCITNKLGIAAALAWQRDDRIVDLYWNTLTKEYANRDFQDNRQDTYEWFGVIHLVELLGFQAAHSERAYALLTNGVRQRFWQTNVSWTIERRPASDVLVRESIVGLALSGRVDAWGLIEKLKQTPDELYLRKFGGAMVDAAHVHYLFSQGGMEYVLGHRTLTDMLRWNRDTVDGRAWDEWDRKIRDSNP